MKRIGDMTKDHRMAVEVYLDVMEKEMDPRELGEFDLGYVKIRMGIIKSYCNEIIRICDIEEEKEDSNDFPF